MLARPLLPCPPPLVRPRRGRRCSPQGPPGLSLRGTTRTFLTPTETNVHGDALCFMIMGPPLLQRVAVGGGWRLAVGGWRLVVPGGCA